MHPKQLLDHQDSSVIAAIPAKCSNFSTLLMSNLKVFCILRESLCESQYGSSLNTYKFCQQWKHSMRSSHKKMGEFSIQGIPQRFTFKAMGWIVKQLAEVKASTKTQRLDQFEKVGFSWTSWHGSECSFQATHYKENVFLSGKFKLTTSEKLVSSQWTTVGQGTSHEVFQSALK